jgi:hypothetical protein
LVDKILAPGSGVTYDLFVDTPAEGEEVPAEEPQLDEEGNPIPVPEKEPEEVLPKHMVIPEVVRDDRVFFYRVTKLPSMRRSVLRMKSVKHSKRLSRSFKRRLKPTAMKPLSLKKRPGRRLRLSPSRLRKCSSFAA